jgi:hypothetical protein
MVLWVDPADPDVVSRFPGGDPDDIAGAIAVASSLLTRLTAFLVHPAGVNREDYTSAVPITRLTPMFRPITRIISVERRDQDGGSEDVTPLYSAHGGNVWLVGATGMAARCRPGPEMLTMRYEYGSTVGPAARRAVIAYAEQLWLMDNPEAGECRLPERVTSVNREGVSWTVIDPQQYLDKGRTGMPGIDQFISAVNPAGAKRPASVHSPDAPPGVGIR